MLLDQVPADRQAEAENPPSSRARASSRRTNLSKMRSRSDGWTPRPSSRTCSTAAPSVVDSTTSTRWHACRSALSRRLRSDLRQRVVMAQDAGLRRPTGVTSTPRPRAASSRASALRSRGSTAATITPAGRRGAGGRPPTAPACRPRAAPRRDGRPVGPRAHRLSHLVQRPDRRQRLRQLVGRVGDEPPLAAGASRPAEHLVQRDPEPFDLVAGPRCGSRADRSAAVISVGLGPQRLDRSECSPHQAGS